MRVLVACERSGVVREAFRARGHEAWSCDLVEADDGSPWHRRGDAREVMREGWDLMIAHPPCTDLASSGARWWREKGRERQDEAVRFFCEFLLFSGVGRVCVENPVGVIGTRVCEPTQIVEPWWFGDPETKKTGLWLRGLRPLVADRVVQPWRESVWRMGRTRDRGSRRSVTWPGMARAMAEQWG